MGNGPNSVSFNLLHNLLNTRYQRYTDVKLFYTRSLFGAKRAFRNNTVFRKTSFDPVDCSYAKNKPLVKRSPYETINFSQGQNYSKKHPKIDNSINPEGFRRLILNFTSDIVKGLYTMSKNCNTEAIRIWIIQQCTLAILLKGIEVLRATYDVLQ
jgi:hypothetical protein